MQFEDDSHLSCRECERATSECECFPFGKIAGSLVLIWAHATDTSGESLAVAVDVHVLDGPQRGEVAEDVLVYGGLAELLAPAAEGRPCLGRAGKTDGVFDLLTFTSQDEATAQAYMRQLHESDEPGSQR